MSKSETGNVLSRRHFIGSGASLGAVGLGVSLEAKADKPPDKFKDKKPMRPAPAQVQASISIPPLAALMLNKAAYGPKPGDIEAFNALGNDDAERLSAWVEQQLNPSPADPEIESRLQALLDTHALDETARNAWCREQGVYPQQLHAWRLEIEKILQKEIKIGDNLFPVFNNFLFLPRNPH